MFSLLAMIRDFPVVVEVSHLHPASSNLMLLNFCFKLMYFVKFIEVSGCIFFVLSCKIGINLKQEFRVDKCSTSVYFLKFQGVQDYV